MWELLAYALVAAGSVLSTYYTNKQNRKESDKQRQWQETMLDKQNEYNTPDNQVDRLMDAGINPIAGIMSNGMSVSGNTSAVPGNYQLPNIYDPMSLLGQNAQGLASAFRSSQEALSDKTFRSAKLDQIQSQNEQIRASVANLHASTQAQTIANKYADMRELWALKGEKASFDLSYSEIAKNNATIRELNESVKNLITERGKTESEIQLNYLRLDEVLAHIADLEASAGLKSAQTVESVASAANIEQDTILKGEQTELTAQESSRYSELTDNVIAQYQAAIEKMKAETSLTEEEAYWYLFKVMSQDNVKFGPLNLNPTVTSSFKAARKIDKKFKEKYVE